MVFYSIQADRDLESISLIELEKIELSRELVLNYLSDLKEACESLSLKNYHFNASYSDHKRYGFKMFKYKRNPNTTWYIIYDVDIYNNIYINKIISNHLTFKTYFNFIFK